MYVITLSFSTKRSRCTASIDSSLVAIPTASTIRGHNEKTIELRDDYLAFIWATVCHRPTSTGANSALTAIYCWQMMQKSSCVFETLLL